MIGKIFQALGDISNTGRERERERRSCAAEGQRKDQREISVLSMPTTERLNKHKLSIWLHQHKCQIHEA